MKKILLATTALAFSAGFAAADVSFSGSAAAGVASAAGGDFAVYSSASLDVTFSGSSDNGLEFGATFGDTYGFSYDAIGDFGSGSVITDETGTTFGTPEVFISGSFGRIGFQRDGYDFFDDANGGGDVKYTGTFGAFSVGLIADAETSEASAMAEATFGGIALHADADTLSEYNVSAAYTMGAFGVKVGTNDEEDHYIKGSYTAGAISAYAQYNALADGNQWEVGGSYSNNGITVSAMTDESGYGELTAAYDLGGGLSVVGGANTDKDAFVGAEMSF